MEEDDIIQDLKVNENSPFLSMFSNEAIRKLIDYATNLPSVDDIKLRNKYSFNATEILIADNSKIQEILMNEIWFKKREFYGKEEVIEESKNDEKEYKEEEEEKDREDIINIVIVYDNIDYLLKFLKGPKEVISNYVLVGYFSKILNHLITSQSSFEIVKYILDYPFKDFDLLDAFVKNMNRESIGSIINKLLLFSEENIDSDIDEKKLILLKKMLEELEKTDEKDKYECICDVFCSTLNDKSFYILIMGNNELVDLLFSLLEKSVGNIEKLVNIIQLVIKVNENMLQNFSKHCTNNLVPDIKIRYWKISDTFNDNLTSYEFPDSEDEKKEKLITDEEMDEINKKVLLSLLDTLKRSKFNFLEDLGECTQVNEEFWASYDNKQKKIGMKKLVQIEFLRTILDIFVNAYHAGINQIEIIELINMMKEKNIFYNYHKLFFNFPNCNMYQIFYNQIVDIVLNKNSTKNLVEYFFKYTDEKKVERNLGKDLMNNFFNKMKLSFSNCQAKASFGSNVSFDITLINKIVTSENENVKKLFDNDKDLKVFNEVIGSQINHIFNQELLFNDILDDDEEFEDEGEPLPTFDNLNFMDVVGELTDIYKYYKEGGDFKKKLKKNLKEIKR